MKPGFFQNEELSELSAMHRLCFAGLWLLADKAGRLEDRPRRIKGELFMYENADVEGMLSDLAAGGFIHRYVVAGESLIQIKNFAKHQRPHKDEPVSKLPPCDESQLECVDSPRESVRGTGTGNGDGERRTENSTGGVEKAPTPTRDFLAWFVDEYKARRHGARYLVKPKHGGIVKQLLLTIPPERLRLHATILLTATTDDWIEETDRGIEVLAGKINWLEERLCAWEVKRKAREVV